MMKYYLGLKSEVEDFISSNYEFQIEPSKRLRARVSFKYRSNGSSAWNEGEHFGRNERDYIATRPRFKEYEKTIKTYFPYRLLYKMAVDTVVANKFALSMA